MLYIFTVCPTPLLPTPWAALALTTSLTFALSSSFSALLLAAIFGVISPSGNEIGPFQAIEISALSEVTPQRGRTM
ncbi:hypothetical protein B484DRAFT_412491 [Ochromonadaceae sp. CCMP2298]|nr:hypothetical protein B484DRAFT_412491 [Ochromonadaceae sp. CCMP2298]